MSSNTTSKVITTKAGEALIAQMQAENKVLVIDKFIFANVPNRPDFPQREDRLPTEYVVHESAVHEQGRMTENSVIYSTTLASNVGPFTFNWSGLYCSEHNTLVAINFPAAVDKTVDGPGVTGNTLVRSFVLEYKGIAETTNITVDPASWQYDAHKRMSKMDNDSAQAIIDQNGKDWFIDDGFIVTPQSTAYNIKAGAGYVSGHRISLDFDRIIQVPEKPAFIYVDAFREGSPTGEWQTKFTFVAAAEEKDDYTDAQGVNHFVCKIAQVFEDGSVGDLRSKDKVDIYINSINNLQTTRDAIEWMPKLKITSKHALRLFRYTDESGIEGYYLPNVNSLPFTTENTFTEDMENNRFLYYNNYRPIIDARELGFKKTDKPQTSTLYKINDYIKKNGECIIDFSNVGKIKLDRSDVRELPYGFAVVFDTYQEWLNANIYLEPTCLIGEDDLLPSDRSSMIYFKKGHKLINCNIDGSANYRYCNANLETSTIVSARGFRSEIIGGSILNSVASAYIPAGVFKVIGTKLNFYGDHAIYLRSGEYTTHEVSCIDNVESIQGNDHKLIYTPDGIATAREAIKLADKTRRVTITNCNITGTIGVNLEAISQLVKVTGNTFITAYAGVMVCDPDLTDGQGGKMVTISGQNQFLDYQDEIGEASYGGWRTKSVMFNAKSNMTLNDFVISNNQMRNASIVDSYNSASISGIKISGNTMINCGVSFTDPQSKRNVITSNIIKGKLGNIYVRGSNTVKQNDFYDCTEGLVINQASNEKDDVLLILDNNFHQCASDIKLDKYAFNVVYKGNNHINNNADSLFINTNGVASDRMSGCDYLNNNIYGAGVLTENQALLTVMAPKLPEYINGEPTREQMNDVINYLSRATTNGCL
ncbi:phage tail protein [Photobacterium damselae]|uniref:phage tail-collar fiber domain-containing protein n=1 Tax=Photobacterium damselae TaxID=38293 RepID=UPI001EFEBB1E|nr:phage tail protein [Photobacterium damselae]MCG9778738.1 phage tail protein [Photobacterium damselae]